MSFWSTAFTDYICVKRTDIWLGWFGGHPVIFAITHSNSFKKIH